jgi:hypothetical protein
LRQLGIDFNSGNLVAADLEKLTQLAVSTSDIENSLVGSNELGDQAVGGGQIVGVDVLVVLHRPPDFCRLDSTA